MKSAATIRENLHLARAQVLLKEIETRIIQGMTNGYKHVRVHCPFELRKWVWATLLFKGFNLLEDQIVTALSREDDIIIQLDKPPREIKVDNQTPQFWLAIEEDFFPHFWVRSTLDALGTKAFTHGNALEYRELSPKEIQDLDLIPFVEAAPNLTGFSQI